MTFELNEMAALKRKLSDIRVLAATYPEGGKVVPVHVVGPDFQMGEADYPGIYLRHGAVIRAADREHRGPILLPYAPEGFESNVLVPSDPENPDPSQTEPWLIPGSAGDPRVSPYFTQDVPVPFDIHFDVNVLTRNYQETMQIKNQLQTRHYLSARFAFLEVPEDGTVRTLELTGGPSTVLTDDTTGKRILQTLYSVSVASELNMYEIEQLTRVTEVILDVYEI